MKDATSAITLNNVNYTTDGVHILKNVSGEVLEGKITTVVGPSGAGKTTLFKLCNGLQSPDSGSIKVHGNPIDSYEPVQLRRKVGIALQNATMVSGTVRENLDLPLKLRGESLSDKRAIELLSLVSLNDIALDKKTKDLSGGQQQKLSIARTLVNQPDILLLDEITSSLDSVSRQDIEKLISRINQEYGTTILWITHSLQQAMEIGHQTWVMMDGELVEEGESSFLKDPQHERVKQFVRGEIE
ncbi:phosphate ABC transporter ATP-binding protein, PhoT family [Lentibacillus persicus]|uniref:Phosphate ABC transporter ATP-binding protein, PhoT family n=1 Tax=Lentibacillus persicus TaxID=640948 RepID=A0A1I1YZN9_9BACI|nr:phosphate ABC transporter ATP-binding protein [Lentibacillus persicus]SFE24917.1 phosphate ABC transporter ATP-binding protein, PhoT family [Lentibacillus persicus]